MMKPLVILAFVLSAAPSFARDCPSTHYPCGEGSCCSR